MIGNEPTQKAKPSIHTIAKKAIASFNVSAEEMKKLISDDSGNELEDRTIRRQYFNIRTKALVAGAVQFLCGKAKLENIPEEDALHTIHRFYAHLQNHDISRVEKLTFDEAFKTANEWINKELLGDIKTDLMGGGNKVRRGRELPEDTLLANELTRREALRTIFSASLVASATPAVGMAYIGNTVRNRQVPEDVDQFINIGGIAGGLTGAFAALMLEISDKTTKYVEQRIIDTPPIITAQELAALEAHLQELVPGTFPPSRAVGNVPAR